MWSRERFSVCAHFAILGFVCAAWVSSIDDLKLLLGLTKDQLGWLLFSGPVGNLVSFTFASSLVARLGSRRSVRISAGAYLTAATILMLSFLLRAPVAVWCVAIACLGCAGNVLNISINAQAGLLEKRAGRQIMSSFHAVFSLTCLIGGLLALLSTALSIPVATRLAVTLAVAVGLHLLFLSGLPSDEVSDAADTTNDRRWHFPDRSLVALGLAALVIMGCEGAVSDWVGVFYRESLGAPAARVKWGFCAVMGLMAFGRCVSDGLVNRFGAARVLHTDCLFVAGGLALALSTPFLPLAGLSAHLTATLGYAVTGFGIAGLVPILYSKANRTKSMPPASALTFVGSMGFLGYFMGPPLIGHLAEVFNLSIALGLFAVLILLCLFLDPDR